MSVPMVSTRTSVTSEMDASSVSSHIMDGPSTFIQGSVSGLMDSNTPVFRGSLSSMDSNESPHMDVTPQATHNRGSSIRKMRAPTTLHESDRTYVVKGRTSSKDRENRDDPIFLDEVTVILLEGIHQDTAKAVLESLGRFADVCGKSMEHRDQACQLGAPAAIVTLMRKWSTHKVVQAACFRVLIALTVGEESIKVRKTLWMAGGTEQILDAMAHYPESRSVQFFGCNALLSLLPSGSEEGNEKLKKWMGRRFVRQHNGVKTVIAAMIQFEEDRALQEAGCSVLLKLATFMHTVSDRKLLLESGAVSAFSVALESHPNDEDIQHYTTFFMNFMSGDL